MGQDQKPEKRGSSMSLYYCFGLDLPNERKVVPWLGSRMILDRDLDWEGKILIRVCIDIENETERRSGCSSSNCEQKYDNA